MSSKHYNAITRVAVIGAGTMGAAIAQHFLMKGLQVTLVDNQQAGLKRGLGNIQTSLAEAVQRRILTEAQKATLLGNLASSTDYAQLSNCQFVVEAVFEDFQVKQAVFKKVEAQVPADCIIASNTSSFSITELGSVLQQQDRFLGVHYFYHAAKNKLIEIIPGNNTTQIYIDQLTAFYHANDKTPIVVADVYGFAVNRFFVPWLNEATRLLEEGLGSIHFIDAVAVEAFQVGMGPFALMNATGVPIAMHAAQTLADHFGPLYAPSESLKSQVAAGKDWDCESRALSTRDGCNCEQSVRERLLGITLGVAAQMVSEKVASATDTDLGARLGLRWPFGPFEMMQQLGEEKVATLVTAAFARWRQPLPAIIRDRNAAAMAVNHVSSHVLGTTGMIEFNRPDAMNALNEGVVAQLAECFDTLEQNPGIDKIVLFGRGKAFVAGADIKFFVDNILNQNLQRIYNFTLEGQQLLSRIAASTKHTIAYLDGLALGGGVELALACDQRVGTSRTVVAFPETGIGIYPGLGGTQRTTRLVGKGMAKFLVATGTMLNATQALSSGMMDAVVGPCVTLEEVAAINVVAGLRPTNDASVQAFANYDGLLSSAIFDDPQFKKHEKALKQKAPLALAKAMNLIDAGADLELVDALELELAGLYEMFSTQDALKGLSGIINRQKVVFNGA
ncbi:MAG: 3-hydroxyacyl-CoA dehydrogenase NAD-binding domain-containing protein [Motiliproteus sp.]